MCLGQRIEAMLPLDVRQPWRVLGLAALSILLACDVHSHPRSLQGSDRKVAPLHTTLLESADALADGFALET